MNNTEVDLKKVPSITPFIKGKHITYSDKLAIPEHYVQMMPSHVTIESYTALPV